MCKERTPCLVQMRETSEYMTAKDLGNCIHKLLFGQMNSTFELALKNTLPATEIVEH